MAQQTQQVHQTSTKQHRYHAASPEKHNMLPS